MDNKHNEYKTILRQYLGKELLTKEVNAGKLSLQEIKDLQYEQHLKQLEPIIYKEQE